MEQQGGTYRLTSPSLQANKGGLGGIRETQDVPNLQWPDPTEALSAFFQACAETYEYEREVIVFRPKKTRDAHAENDGSRLPVGMDGITKEEVIHWLHRQGWPAQQVTIQLIRRERQEGESRFLKQVTVLQPYTYAATGTEPTRAVGHRPVASPVVTKLEEVAVRVLANPEMAIQSFAAALGAVGEAWGKSVEKGRMSAAEGAAQEIRGMIQQEAAKIAGQAPGNQPQAQGNPNQPQAQGNQPDPTEIIKALHSMMQQQNSMIAAQNERMNRLEEAFIRAANGQH